MNESPPERTSSRFETEVRNVIVGGLFFLLFLAAVSLIVLRNMADWGEREYLERLTTGTELVVERAAPTSDPASMFRRDVRVGRLLLDIGARCAALYDADGNLLADAPFLPDHDLSALRLPAETGPPSRPVSFALVDEPKPMVFVKVRFLDGKRIVRLGFDGRPLAEVRRNVRVISVTVPLAALVVALLTVPFLRRLLRPIEALAETAKDAGSVIPAPEELPPPRDEAEGAVATFQRTIEELRRRSAELEELRRHEQERADELAVTAQTLVRSHPGGLLVVDRGSRVAEANDPARLWLDLPDEAIGRPADECLSAFATLREAVERAARGEPTLTREFVSGEGTVARQLAVTAAPVEDAAGRPLGTLLFLEDRTVTNRLSRELSVRRELAALGEMSAGIAHEFRNATATILGYARLAAGASDAAARERYLAGIRSEAEHVARVTGDFLFFARPEGFAPARLDLRPLVQDIVDEERLANPETTYEVEGSFAEASVDAALVRRALINLVRNAREAAGAGGRGGRVLVSGEGARDGRAMVTVEDDGAGVPEEAAAKVFVPFYSTKESGTGLGLALVAKIAALHNGAVAVERSERLGGARFVLSLASR